MQKRIPGVKERMAVSFLSRIRERTAAKLLSEWKGFAAVLAVIYHSFISAI
jgi:hypothetical protein